VVRLLEDKFDGLELNHIARRSNEAADELAKLAFDQAPVPTGVFANNLYKPSSTYQESAQDDSEPPASGANSTPAPADPEVIQIEEDPYTGPDPLLDWRIPYLDCLVRGVLPTDKTEVQRLARRAKSFVFLDWELYKWSPTGILQHCIPSEQGKIYYRTSTGASTATMQRHAPSSGMRSGKVSTGSLPWLTPPSSTLL
jgi:hypothetical protein